MILHRPPKKKVHSLPEKGPGKPQAQRIKDQMRVTGIGSEASERTSGTRHVLSTQNSNDSRASLESGKFVPNIGRSQSLKRGRTTAHFGMPHIHTQRQRRRKKKREKAKEIYNQIRHKI